MDVQQVIENLDSLWFFGTVFSNITTLSAIQKLENPTLNNVEEPSGEEIATPTLQNQQTKSPASENVVQKTVEDGGFASEIKTEAVPEVETPSKATEKEEKRRRNRRSSRRSSCLSQKRKILGEIDLSFAVKEISECWLFEQRNRGENQKKMPPFEDSMAMKEHIRSWAYAVACTVR